MKNPNPQRITDPLWWLVLMCTGATRTAFAAEYGGTWARNPDGGSHADIGWLLATRPQDYSLRGAMQLEGPRDKGRAFDWTFPSAQRGDWSEIGIYSTRIQRAWEANDERCFGLFEVLCQTPEDRQPEGYVFYPGRRFRVPDRSHEWHIHFGILTAYIDNWDAIRGIWSVLSGQTLADWRRERAAAAGSKGGTDMFVIHKHVPGTVNHAACWWAVSDALRFRPITTWPQKEFYERTSGVAELVVEDDAAFALFAGRLDELVDPIEIDEAAAVQPPDSGA